MKIAVLSDIHDNIWNLRAALDWIGDDRNGISAMILCGDLCSPFVLGMIQEAFALPIHLVFGNNDGDAFRITKLAGSHVVIHGELAELTCREGRLEAGISADRPGLTIAVNHFDAIARGLIDSGRYDVVCYGHNHKQHLAKVRRAGGGHTLVINPGALMGFDPLPMVPGKHDIPATFAVLDTETMEVVYRET